MKLLKSIFTVLLISLSAMTFAQDEDPEQIPTDITIYDQEGNPVNLADIVNHDGLTIVDFWATWCRPCHMEMQELAEKYDEWTEETGVKMILISIDKADKYEKIPAILEKYGWKGESYIDRDFAAKQAIGVTQIPNVFLVDKDGNVLYHTLGYSSSGLRKMYKTIKKNSN